MSRSVVALGFAFVLVAGSFGCGAAHQKLVGQPVRQRVAILVSISDQVDAADDGGGVATLADTVSAGLKENGIDSQIYASKYDHAPPPRIELDVIYWHGTSAISHQLAAASYVVRPLGAGALATAGNRIIVDCRVFLPGKAQPVFAQRFDYRGMGLGWSETDDTSSASHAGNAIVANILTR